MKASCPLNQKILSVIFDENIIEDYLELSRRLGVDDDFPFGSHEHNAIRWQAAFPLIAYALSDNESACKGLLLDAHAHLAREGQETVLVGNYIRAKRELFEIKPHFGFFRLVTDMRKKQLDLGSISDLIYEFKIKAFLAIFQAVEAQSMFIGYRENRGITELYAIAMLASYWGREPLESEEKYIDGLGLFLYEKMAEIVKIIDSSE